MNLFVFDLDIREPSFGPRHADRYVPSAICQMVTWSRPGSRNSTVKRVNGKFCIPGRTWLMRSKPWSLPW